MRDVCLIYITWTILYLSYLNIKLHRMFFKLLFWKHTYFHIKPLISLANLPWEKWFLISWANFKSAVPHFLFKNKFHHILNSHSPTWKFTVVIWFAWKRSVKQWPFSSVCTVIRSAQNLIFPPGHFLHFLFCRNENRRRFTNARSQKKEHDSKLHITLPYKTCTVGKGEPKWRIALKGPRFLFIRVIYTNLEWVSGGHKKELSVQKCAREKLSVLVQKGNEDTQRTL